MSDAPSSRSHPAAYRQQIIASARSGCSAKERAKEFEPPEQPIRNWIFQAEADRGERPGVITTEERAELTRLQMAIRAALARSNGTYRAPRLLEDLRDAGHHVGPKRVARLMRAEGLHGVSKRRDPARPRRVPPESPPAPDLLTRAFRATAPNQRWVAGITYIPTAARLLYLATVLDVFSRRVIGWALRDGGRAPLGSRSQYNAFTFEQRCRTLGVRPSKDSRGDAYANAMAESFCSTLECECLATHRFASHTEARLVLFRYIEGWYNPHRRHSALGQRSPLAFEQLHAVRSRAA